MDRCRVSWPGLGVIAARRAFADLTMCLFKVRASAGPAAEACRPRSARPSAKGTNRRAVRLVCTLWLTAVERNRSTFSRNCMAFAGSG